MDLIKQKFDQIVNKAQSLQADVELLLTGGESLSFGFQKGKVDSFKNSQTQMAGFRVIKDGKQGYAYTENLSEESLLRTFQAAYENALMLEDGDTESIQLMTPQNVKAMTGVNGVFPGSLEEKMKMAADMVEQFFKKDSRITAVPYNSFGEVKSFKRVLNSKGVDHTFEQSFCHGHAYALAKQGDISKMGGDGFFARTPEQIDIDKVVDVGVEKATALLGAMPLKTGVYPVVIDRDEFATMLSMLESYFSAKDLYEGKSLLQGKLGQKIGSDAFTLIDDPFESLGTDVRPFDDEGAPSQKISLFEKGTFKNFLTNFEYSRKMNLPHTAHAARSPASQMDISASNLVVGKGAKSLEELLSSYDEVVHLTHFTGGLHAGFKQATGDFSMPAEGFLYRKGQLVGPVDSFVVSGNIIELLGKVIDVGNQYNKGGSSKICPDVLVSELSFAGAR